MHKVACVFNLLGLLCYLTSSSLHAKTKAGCSDFFEMCYAALCCAVPVMIPDIPDKGCMAG